jgi:hypothetical protein
MGSVINLERARRRKVAKIAKEMWPRFCAGYKTRGKFVEVGEWSEVRLAEDGYTVKEVLDKGKILDYVPEERDCDEGLGHLLEWPKKGA